MRQRFHDTIHNRERARFCESLQYILTGNRNDTHEFVSMLSLVTWVVVTIWLIFTTWSYWTEVCRGCDKCIIPEGECGNLISTPSGDVFCTKLNTYLRPTVSSFSVATYTETIDMCKQECPLRFSNTVKLNYTNVNTGHQIVNQHLDYAESKCIQLKMLTRNPNCNNVCK